MSCVLLNLCNVDECTINCTPNLFVLFELLAGLDDSLSKADWYLAL